MYTTALEDQHSSSEIQRKCNRNCPSFQYELKGQALHHHSFHYRQNPVTSHDFSDIPVPFQWQTDRLPDFSEFP